MKALTDEDIVMTDDATDRALLRAVLEHILQNGAFPAVGPFRNQHVTDTLRLDQLEKRGLVRTIEGRYYLTFDGLRACDSDDAEHQLKACNEILPLLRQGSMGDPNEPISVARLKIWGKQSVTQRQLLVYLAFFMASGLIRATPDRETGLPFDDFFWIEEIVLSITSVEPPRAAPNAPASSLEFAGSALQTVEIRGYRSFAEFCASPGELTVIIGANATGKSSLFDFLRFVNFASSSPLPSEIDPRSIGKRLFFVGGEERISFALTIGKPGEKGLRYEVEIQGPIGAVKVTRERLFREQAEGVENLVDMRGGKGAVRDPADASTTRRPWTLPPNELALRRALDPSLATIAKFQSFLASWRFYSGFDVSPSAAIRRPAQIEENPVLSEDGGNLSAVLNSIVLEHRDAWEEIETLLRSAIPGFRSLGVKPRGGRGMAMAVWREDGVDDDLTLADLSDGTLRLLAWLALVLSPSIPPLICVDEPEIGLHPRVLPTLAGAFKHAAARTQILIATHSPHFLSQFKLEDIAVMRKDNGRARFVRPATSEALRREVEEIGGEALARLFLSDELEVLP